ncbi:MAG: glycoside hydrolase family 99-like domain-containing protein [Candidatus Woesearchaeota archaeon]
MTKIAAYYYPGWHRQQSLSSYNSDDEWEIVKNAKPYFDEHYQPRIPQLGYLDDSKIETLEKQVNLAQSFGVDAFIFDWYWKKDVKYFEKSIRSFMQLDTEMEFALMYSWKLPRKIYPIQLVEQEDNRWVDVNIKDFKNLLNYCCDNYFSKKNYWKIDNKPYFVMYFVEGFISKIGKQGLSDLISEGNSLLKSKGYNGLYTVGVVSDPPENSNKSNYAINNLGFDALTGYNFLADFTKKGKLFQDYVEFANRRVNEWSVIKSLSELPYIPSISTGWDATPRGVRVEKLTEGMIFPWSPIVLNNTPENFGNHIKQGLDFIKSSNQKNTSNDVLHVCAWNEWSEGAYLEPDLKHGTGFLDAIKKLKNSK